MAAKSAEVKAIEKKMKEEQKIARETARRERAAQIIGSARYIDGFRVLDPDARSLVPVTMNIL